MVTKKSEPLTDDELFREARHFAIANAVEYSNEHKLPVATCVGPPKCNRNHSRGFLSCMWCFEISRCEDRTVEQVDAALQAHIRGH